VKNATCMMVRWKQMSAWNLGFEAKGRHRKKTIADQRMMQNSDLVNEREWGNS
jgi:hypothetical protein